MSSSSTATGRRLPITLIVTMVLTLVVAGGAKAISGSGSTTTTAPPSAEPSTTIVPTDQQCRALLLPLEKTSVDRVAFKVVESAGYEMIRIDLGRKSVTTGSGEDSCSFCVAAERGFRTEFGLSDQVKTINANSVRFVSLGAKAQISIYRGVEWSNSLPDPLLNVSELSECPE